MTKMTLLCLSLPSCFSWSCLRTGDYWDCVTIIYPDIRILPCQWIWGAEIVSQGINGPMGDQTGAQLTNHWRGNVGVCVLDIWSGAGTAREPKLIISEERVSEEISATGLRSWSQSCTFPWNLSQPIDNYQVLTNQRTEWRPISQSEDPVSIMARRQKSVRGICKLRLASG